MKIVSSTPLTTVCARKAAVPKKAAAKPVTRKKASALAEVAAGS